MSTAPVIVVADAIPERLDISHTRKVSVGSKADGDTGTVSISHSSEDPQCACINAALFEAASTDSAPELVVPNVNATPRLLMPCANGVESEIVQPELLIKDFENKNDILADSIKRHTEENSTYSANMEKIVAMGVNAMEHDAFAPLFKENLDGSNREHNSLVTRRTLAQIVYADDEPTEQIDTTQTSNNNEEEDNEPKSYHVDGWYFALPDAEAVVLAMERCDPVPSDWLERAEVLNDDDSDESDAEWDDQVDAMHGLI